MVREGLLISTPPRSRHHGIDVDDGCSQSLESHSDISDDDVEGGGETMTPVWKEDGEEDEEGGGSVFTPRHDAVKDVCEYPPNSVPLDLRTLEISFPLSHEEEPPSPSSVSCQNTVELPASATPALPADYLALASASRMPSYRMRWQRRVEELKRRASHDFDSDQDPPAHAQRANLQQQTSPSYLASSSSSLSFPLQQQQRSRSSATMGSQGRIRPGTSPRFLMMLCALTLVVLSVHDRVEPPPRFVSDTRVEEVAFPLRPEPLTKQQRAALPKYYLPAPVPGAAASAADKAASGGKGKSRELQPSQQKRIHRSNLAMARPSLQQRTVFVPEGEEGAGQYSIQRERFVFDTRQQQQQTTQNQQDQGEGGTSSPSHRPRALSWTSWVASVALVGMLVDTGWKEYQKCRVWEEQRSL